MSDKKELIISLFAIIVAMAALIIAIVIISTNENIENGGDIDLKSNLTYRVPNGTLITTILEDDAMFDIVSFSTNIARSSPNNLFRTNSTNTIIGNDVIIVDNVSNTLTINDILTVADEYVSILDNVQMSSDGIITNKISFGTHGQLLIPQYSFNARENITPKDGQLIFNTDTDVLNIYSRQIWQDIVSSKAYTQTSGVTDATSGFIYLCDTKTTGVFNINLPTAQANGNSIRVIDVIGNFSTFPVTLVAGGTDTVQGGPSNEHKLSDDFGIYDIYYSSEQKTWIVSINDIPTLNTVYHQEGNTVTMDTGSPMSWISVTDDFNINLTSTGSFNIQNSGSNIFTAAPSGALTFATTSGQDIMLTSSGVGDVNINGTLLVSSDGDVTVSPPVEGDITLSADDVFILSVDGNIDLKAQNSLVMDASNDITVTATDNITITATDDLTLTARGGSKSILCNDDDECVLSATGGVRVASGTAFATSYGVSSSPAGFFVTAPDTTDVRLRCGETSGDIDIRTSATVSGGDMSFNFFGTVGDYYISKASIDRFRISHAGTLAITAPLDQRTTITATDITNGSSGLDIYAYTDAAAPHCQILCGKSRGSVGAETTLQSGDDVAAMTFAGYDGVGFSTGSTIKLQTIETWSGTQHGCQLSFQTVNITDNTPSEQLRVGRDVEVLCPGGSFVTSVKASDPTSKEGMFFLHSTDNNYRGWDTTGSQYVDFQTSKNTTLVDGVNIDWDLNDGFFTSINITGNTNMNNPTNIVIGSRYCLAVTGGDKILTWATGWLFPGGIIPSLSANTNVLDFIATTSTTLALLSNANDIQAS